jgi:integral membrane sensor domain MASE1
MNPVAPAPALTLRQALLALVFYGLAALLSIRLSAHPGQIAAPWFANPIGTVALLALPSRRWLPMLLALGLVNLLVNLGTTPGAWRWTLQTGLEAAAFVPGNAAELLLAALLLRQVGMNADTLRQPGGLGRVLVLGALLPTFCSAFAGAALVAAPARPLADAWTQWFAGSLIGTVAVLPLALAVWLHGTVALRRSLRQPRTLAYLSLSAAITLLAMTTLPRPFVVMSIGLVRPRKPASPSPPWPLVMPSSGTAARRACWSRRRPTLVGTRSLPDLGHRQPAARPAAVELDGRPDPGHAASARQRAALSLALHAHTGPDAFDRPARSHPQRQRALAPDPGVRGARGAGPPHH